MGLRVMFVSGPRRSGKSALIRSMLDTVWKIKPHYIRLIRAGGDKQPAPPLAKPPEAFGVASARNLEYCPERVFEVLPAALQAIHRKDRYGAVIVEGDADPILRCAYPYDYRIFVMPVPQRFAEIFRTPQEAAHEFRRVLDDTAAFASEIYGMITHMPTDDGDPAESRAALSDTQMRRFLYTPLGDELATRIQLQPPYHGLFESDVIIVNTGAAEATPESQTCINRVAKLLSRIGEISGRYTEMILCNPAAPKDRECKKLLKLLQAACIGGS